MRINDFGTELGDAPRWAQRSLAESVSHGWGIQTIEDRLRQADAIERLTRAARAIVDSYRLDTQCGCGSCPECKFVLEVEAAEEWNP